VPKVRADVLLTQRGLAPSRARAQALILAGKVFTGDRRIDKSGETLDEAAPVEVREPDHPYVSRGGVKLAGALDAFGYDPVSSQARSMRLATTPLARWWQTSVLPPAASPTACSSEAHRSCLQSTSATGNYTTNFGKTVAS
jgi:ribosomal protein S4